MRLPTCLAHSAPAVGYHAAHYFSQQGAKIVCVVEHDGYVFNSQGLNIAALNKVCCICVCAAMV